MGRWRGALPSAGSHGVLLAPVVMYEHCLHCFDDQHIRSSVIYEYTCQVPTYCICYQLSCIVPTYVQVCRGPCHRLPNGTRTALCIAESVQYGCAMRTMVLQYRYWRTVSLHMLAYQVPYCMVR